MNLTVIYVGDLKERYYKEAVAEYEKRLGRFCRVKNIEIKEEKSSPEPSVSEINAILNAEGKRILDALPPRALRVALCVEGKAVSSEELAQLLQREARDAAFVIGGSWGLSEQVKQACDVRISFSRMTFPHRLMRVMLAEQLYRAMSINEGGAYHK